MPYLDRDGVRIFYESAGSGPAVLLSHGYGATSEMWSRQVALLSGGHKVMTWDMRGHGKTDSPEEQALYSEDASVEDMKAVLDATGTERAVIGGLSLGGYYSLAFYRRYPERALALMLFDTGPGYRNPQSREAWNQNAYRRASTLEEKGLEAMTGGVEVQTSTHRSAAGLARAARGMLAQSDSRVIESLEQVTVPTLVLVGSRDEPFLLAADYMADRIPGARKVVIPDAGHASNLDEPEAFNQAVSGFLASLSL
jgi:pimeloyl-ACP methyl ester carboxylesterase